VSPPSFGVQLFSPTLNVPAGTEVQNCYYFKNPSRVDLEITRFQVIFPPGSHHTTLFETDTNYPDHMEDCFNGVNNTSALNPDGMSIVFASARGDMDFSLPPSVSYHLPANRQMMLQVHYVNAADVKTDSSPQVFYNLYATRDTSAITAHLGAIQAMNRAIVIPPHSTEKFSADCSVGQEVNLIGATGHFHSRGTELDVNIAPDNMNNVESTPIYANTTWNDQPFKIFKEPVQVHASGGFRYSCSYTNTTENTYTFGNRVETDEHCIVMLYVYPWNGPFGQCITVPH
jgi:hypothetical protein